MRRHVVTVFGKCMPGMGLACDERAADPVTTWQRVVLASSRQQADAWALGVVTGASRGVVTGKCLSARVLEAW